MGQRCSPCRAQAPDAENVPPSALVVPRAEQALPTALRPAAELCSAPAGGDVGRELLGLGGCRSGGGKTRPVVAGLRYNPEDDLPACLDCDVAPGPLRAAARECAPGPLRELTNNLVSSNNMAVHLQEQGKLADAEPFCRHALQGWERKLGPRHPYTLATVQTLAEILQDQGKHKEARHYRIRSEGGQEAEYHARGCAEGPRGTARRGA